METRKRTYIIGAPGSGSPGVGFFNKISTIKEVRRITKLGLKEAKELVEGVNLPSEIYVSQGEIDTLRSLGFAVESTGAAAPWRAPPESFEPQALMLVLVDLRRKANMLIDNDKYEQAGNVLLVMSDLQKLYNIPTGWVGPTA